LVINGRWLTALEISGPASSGNVIRGNYFGTTPDGAADFGTLTAGGGALGDMVSTAVVVSGSGNNTFRGTSAQDRNIFGAGVELVGSSDNIIQGNYFGVDASGERVLRLADGRSWSHTLTLRDGAARNTIGGTSPAARNLFGTTGGVLLMGDGTS